MDKKQLTQQLKAMLDKVPPGVVNSSWNKAVAYKNWVVATRRIANGGKANEAVLKALIRQYESF